MSTTTTGFDQAQHIVPGTVIERVYFVVPGHYTASSNGCEHQSYEEALAQAIALAEAAIDRHAEHGTALAPRIFVDTRWEMWKGGRSRVDLVASRTAYDSPAAAQEHLDRIRRYATPTAERMLAAQRGQA